MGRKQQRQYSGFKRSDRIAAEIKKIMSATILYELSDPRIQDVFLTRVDLSGDNRLAKVFFSVLGAEGDVRQTKNGLDAAAGCFKRKIADNLRLQHTPDIRFVHDPGPAHATEMSEIFKKINEESDRDDPEADDE